MAEECMLSTLDNPFSPFTQWQDWFLFDTMHGYNSCGYLARIAVVSSDLSDEEYSRAVEDAIDEIVEYDPFGIYRKVIRSDYPNAPTTAPSLEEVEKQNDTENADN